MEYRSILVILTLVLTINLSGQEPYEIKFPYKDLTFQEFVTKVESLSNIKIYYKDTWVTDLKLSDYPDCNTLNCILDNLLRQKQLKYFIDSTGNIIVTGNSSVRDMNEVITKNITIPPSAEKKNIANPGLRKDTINLVIGNPMDRNKPGLVNISGYIINGATNEPIAGANVFIQKLSEGAIANATGYFKLTLPRGLYQIQFSFIGMKEKKINLNLCGPGQMNIEMYPNTISLNEVIVTTQKNNTLDRFEVGVERINIKSLELLPTSMGMTDVIKSLSLIPGVQSVGEGSAGFNVRGGSADQNLILLYGAPIYNSSHFFGFFSAVNSDIIKDVTLYKGGIPSRYGGRISSVLNIESKAGNGKKLSGNAGLSPITTNIMIEGPLIKDTLTYLLTARTTYSDWVFKVINDSALNNSKVSFYDLNGKITYHPDNKNKIDFSTYSSHDFFRFNTNTEYNYNNTIFALKWQHSFTDNFSSTFSVNNSDYNYQISNKDIPTDAYILSHSINSSGLKADFNLLKALHEINFGLDLNKYSVIPGSYFPVGDSSLIVPKTIESESALEGAIYIDDKIALTKFLSLNLGIRMSSFLSFGPKTIFTYNPGFSRSNSTIIDTLNVSNGNISAKYAGPEFRASLNFRITEKNSIKINYNRTRQYLHLLSNTTSISPTDTWKLCDYYLKPIVGDQFALGFYKFLFKNSLETSAEIYYKQIYNMVDFKGGSSLTMVDHIEQSMIDVKGRAYGLELVLKKIGEKVNYSLGYTYSRTFAKSLGKFRDEIVNAGNWYPANYDKPNDLVITFQYLYSRRFSFTANYSYSTGRPITYPLSTYRVRDILLVQYSDRNKYRIPYNSRMDVACKVSGNLKSQKIANPNLTFSVYNLLGRQNPYSVFFKTDDNGFKGYLLSVFGKAIPSITLNFDF